MAQALIHRGPDSRGYFVDENAALGTRRLRIIDLETGDQPLFNEDESVVLSCNGEIFNYLELRAELEKKGHVSAPKPTSKFSFIFMKNRESVFLTD